jgi:D-lactate dehydrogenase
LAHFKANGMNQSELKFSMFEPVTFMKLFLAPYLDFEQKKGHVALHVPCTSKQAGLTDNFVQLAERCSKEVSLTGEQSGRQPRKRKLHCC